MITEPEMADGQGGETPTEVLSGSAGAEAATLGAVATRAAAAAAAVTAALRKPRPWMWAAGGAVAASAVWAALLPVAGGTAPDLHGYHVSGNPCDGRTLGALRDVVGVQGSEASDATLSRGPALDKLSCVLSTSAPAGNGWVTDFTVTVGVELHKKTDPRAEFEDAEGARVSTVPGGAQDGSVLLTVTESGFTSADDVRPVTGLGDEAYLVESRAANQSLEVLHGGAVLTLHVSGYSRWNGPGASPQDSGEPPPDPDLTDLHPAMKTAMRDLMRSLAS